MPIHPPLTYNNNISHSQMEVHDGKADVGVILFVLNLSRHNMGIAKSSSFNLASRAFRTLISSYQSCQFSWSSLNAWQNAHCRVHSGVLRIIRPRLQMNAISGKVIHRILLAHILFFGVPYHYRQRTRKDDGKEVIAAGNNLKMANGFIGG